MREHFQGLGHVAVYTQDIEKSIAFYENLGGEVRGRGAVNAPAGEKKLALVLFGGITLELIQSPGAMPMGDQTPLRYPGRRPGCGSGGNPGGGSGQFPDTGEEGPAGPLRRLAELVFHRPLRGAN